MDATRSPIRTGTLLVTVAAVLVGCTTVTTTQTGTRLYRESRHQLTED